MSGPVHTDLAEHTDVYIRRVAERIDAKLAGQIKYVTKNTMVNAVAIDAAGGLWLPFDGLTTVQGAILFPVQTSVNGQITQTGAFAGAPSGAAIPATQPTLTGPLTAGEYNGNWARFRAWTSPWISTTDPNNRRFGAQAVQNGAAFRVAGFAWGV